MVLDSDLKGLLAHHAGGIQELRDGVRQSLKDRPLLLSDHPSVLMDKKKSSKKDKHSSGVVLTEEMTRNELEDDLFLLRYVISHMDETHGGKQHSRDFKTAVEAVRFSLKYRIENDEWLSKARVLDGLKNPKKIKQEELLEMFEYASYGPDEQKVRRFMLVGLHRRTKDGRPMFVIRGGLASGPELLKDTEPEALAKFMTFMKEKAFCLCDELSRRTGQLVKLIAVQDLKYAAFSSMYDRRFFKALGASSSVSDLLHPQLVHKMTIINPPSFLKVVFKFAKLVLSKATLSKVSVCTGSITEGEISQCPVATKFLDPSCIPSFAGGECTCAHKGGCVGHYSNDAEEKFHQPEGWVYQLPPKKDAPDSAEAKTKTSTKKKSEKSAKTKKASSKKSTRKAKIGDDDDILDDMDFDFEEYEENEN